MRIVSVTAPGGLDRLVVGEREAPVAGPGEVLIRVAASSLNYHDYSIAAGKLRVADGRVPMSDGAGTVEAVGDGVEAWRPGDRVMSLFHPNWPAGGATAARVAGVPGEQVDGFAAELVAMPAAAITRMPADWSFAEAATLPCAALTAWRALMVEARIRPGDTVLTQGSGGMSLFAIQFAKLAGARVVATSSSDAKLDRLRALGADEGINYRAVPDWGDRAIALTGGRGVDAVVDVGGTGSMAQSLRAVRVGGHVSMVGALGGWSGEVPLVVATLKNVTMRGLSVGSREEQEAMVAALDASDLRPVIDRTYPMTEIAAAFAYQETQRHVGKICLRW